jgi:hypothetical protein
MSKAGLRAGLVGAVVAAVLSLLGLVPCLGCIASILGLLWYVGVGVLAAYWLQPPRTTGEGAGAGAIAGLITALVGGVVGMIVGAVQFTIAGGPRAILNQIPPEALRQLRDAGIDPRMFASMGWVIGVGAICCGFGLVLAAVLGAGGGAVMAAAKPDDGSNKVLVQE